VSEKCPSLNFSNSSNNSNPSPKKRKTQKVRVIKPKWVRVKDYKIRPKDRPLTTKKLNDILFNQVIQSKDKELIGLDKEFRCPCKNIEKSFA
jgi:hypothetical protein